MDNKETTSETRLNTSDHSKEFGYLNQLKGKIPFDLCENSVYCKKNFFSTFARYIETLKKENTDGWENEIQDFINTVINGGFSRGLELLKNLDKFLGEKQLKRYDENGYRDRAESMRSLYKGNYRFTKKENGKTKSSIIGTERSLVPNRYYERTSVSGLYNEMRNENIKNIANALSGKE